MHITFDNSEFADYLLNSTKSARNKFFKRITEYKNFKRIVHQLGLTPVVTLVRLSQEEVNVYRSSKHNKTYIGSNMSNQIKSHKEKHLIFNNNSKEFSKSLTNKKHIDLFRDNKSIKIPSNKLIQRSHSKQSTKENTIKENKDTKKYSNDKDKNVNKEIFYKDRKEDILTSKSSVSSSSKTKSHKTDDKCESKHRSSSDNKTNSNEYKISRSKIKETLPTSKDGKHLNTEKNNLSKLDSKNSSVIHSKTCSNLDKLKINQDIYNPKKITQRRKSYHHGDNDEEEESTFKRRNSHTSSKTTCLESDKKLNVLQTNKQLSANNSQLRKRSTSSEQSEKENSKKHTPEKNIKLSLNSTKTTDSKREINNENKICKRLYTNDSRKRSASDFSLLNYNEEDLGSEAKRQKTSAGNSPAFSAFSSLDDTEVITIDKTQILPPINDLNSPYVSFGDFLKNKSIPIIESSPLKAPEFSCTQLEGDKLLIKKRNTEKKAIVIDITDDDDDNNDVDDEPNNVIEDDLEIFTNITPKKNYDDKINVAEKSESSDTNKGNTHKTAENFSKLTLKKDLDVKVVNCDNKISVGESLNDNAKCAPDSNNTRKTPKVTESSSKNPKKDCDVKIKKSNKSNDVESLVNSDDSIDKGKKQKATQSSSKISPKKHCEVKMKSSDNKTSVIERLDNGNESSSDLNSKRKTKNVTESSLSISPKKDFVNMVKSDKTSVVESLDNNNGSSSDSTKKRKIQKGTESSPEIIPKKDCDNIKRVAKSLDINKDDSLNETKENLTVNSKPDKQNLQILFTEQAVEFISSDLVSVLNVYIDYKKYTEKLSMSKCSENKEVNKDYFTNHRSKFLKILCKKLQNAKVYNFKIGYFFDSLIESIKIHIAAKEILNEKTINRFIHNVLILFSENCSSPDDHYILYNHVVSVKSLQYLDKKSFSLSDSIDKHIFDCMNSFSVKLERYKDSALPLLFCIDNSPDKITDATPGNSLPCINTGENLVTKISPTRSSDIDMIPQISIVDTNNEKDNKEEDLIDLLQNIPIVANFKNHVAQLPMVERNNNQPTTLEKLNNDALTESIVSELDALFNEKESVIQKTNEVNMVKAQSTNYETNHSNLDETINKFVTLHQTEIFDSPKSDHSDNMNFLKNINPNKSFLAPISYDKNINTSSSVSYQASFNSITNSVLVTPTSTPIAKTNKDTSNKNIKILNDIVVSPAIKQIFKPQSNPIIAVNISTIQETNKSMKRTETVTSSENEKINALCMMSPSTSRNLTPPNKLLKTSGTEEKNKITKRPYVRKKTQSVKNNTYDSNTTGSQLPTICPTIETSTALPRPFPTAAIQKDTFIPTRVGMKDYLNSEVANASANSPYSYMMKQISQHSNSLPISTVASVQLQPTIPSYLPHRQYSDPVQVQQTAPTLHPSTQQSQSQSQRNPVPLTRQMSAPSQLQEPPPAPIISVPPQLQPTRSQQSYLPNNSTSETVSQSSYTSSIGTSPLNLQSSIPHGQITQQVTLKQVVERTFVQQIETQTVHAQQMPNASQYHQYTYQKHLQEMERQAFRYQLAEQERQKEQRRRQKHQEMLKQQQTHERIKQQQKQEMLKFQETQEFVRKQQEILRQQQYQEEMYRLHQQEMYRLQHQQQMINPNMYFSYDNNNRNIATMYNSNNYYSVPSGQVAQPKPNQNQYTYPTYHSGYPAIRDNSMPQLINNSVNGSGGALNYLNNQQTTHNEIRRNNVPTAATTQCNKNNNLIYPCSNNNSLKNTITTNNSTQATINQTARNPNNVPMRNNNTVPSVSHTSVIVKNNASSLFTNNVSSNATKTTSHQIENEQQLQRAGTTMANTSENHAVVGKQKETQRNTNNSLDQHITELEELLNDSETRGAKEMDNIGVRNSSRDSGYMTPTKQFQKDQTCAYCLGVGNFVCSGCVTVYYCSEDCQTKAWPSHQNICFI